MEITTLTSVEQGPRSPRNAPVTVRPAEGCRGRLRGQPAGGLRLLSVRGTRCAAGQTPSPPLRIFRRSWGSARRCPDPHPGGGTRRVWLVAQRSCTWKRPGHGVLTWPRKGQACRTRPGPARPGDLLRSGTRVERTATPASPQLWGFRLSSPDVTGGQPLTGTTPLGRVFRSVAPVAFCFGCVLAY